MTDTTPGLKDHEIAKLVNAVRDELNARITGLPQCLRELILGAVLNSLKEQGRRIDKKICATEGLTKGGRV